MAKYIVHVRVGGDIGGDQPIFLPDVVQLESYRKELQEAFGEDYLVVATHCLVEIEIYDL